MTTEYDPTAGYEDGGETIIDIDTSDAIEPSVAAEGEYKIRITGFKKAENKIIRTDKNGNKYFVLLFDVPSEAAVKTFDKFMGIPNESSMDPKRLNNSKWDLEVFKRAFGLTELNINEMVGKEGWAMIGISPDDGYGEKNFIKKFIAGPTEVTEF